MVCDRKATNLSPPHQQFDKTDLLLAIDYFLFAI
jgi:hypothetical protein